MASRLILSRQFDALSIPLHIVEWNVSVSPVNPDENGHKLEQDSVKDWTTQVSCIHCVEAGRYHVLKGRTACSAADSDPFGPGELTSIQGRTPYLAALATEAALGKKHDNCCLHAATQPTVISNTADTAQRTPLQQFIFFFQNIFNYPCKTSCWINHIQCMILVGASLKWMLQSTTKWMLESTLIKVKNLN